MYEFYLYLYICCRHLVWYIDSCFTILAPAAAIYLYDSDKDDLFEVLKKFRLTAGNNEQGRGACGEKIEID